MKGAASEVLRRKTGAGRPAPEILAMSPEKAMRLAFGRAGRDYSGLGLRMTAFSMERMVVSGLIDAAPECALLSTLVRGDGATGIVYLDPGFLSAVIETETTGKLSKAAPGERMATRIDALIGGAMLDKGLKLFDEMAGDLSIAAAVMGFRMGDMLTSPGMLALLLDDIPYRLIRLEFDFSGVRQGKILLAMPYDPPSPKTEQVVAFGRDLEAAVMAAPAEVRAILPGLDMPLDTVTAWEPGALVPLSREVLDSVVLEDIDGNKVAAGRLGQINGMRAVRLRAQPGD